MNSSPERYFNIYLSTIHMHSKFMHVHVSPQFTKYLLLLAQTCIKPHIGYRLLIWILNEGHFSSDSVNDVIMVKDEKNIWISLINFKIWLTRKGIKR